jgi:hypothetical protein
LLAAGCSAAVAPGTRYHTSGVDLVQCVAHQDTPLPPACNLVVTEDPKDAEAWMLRRFKLYWHGIPIGRVPPIVSCSVRAMRARPSERGQRNGRSGLARPTFRRPSPAKAHTTFAASRSAKRKNGCARLAIVGAGAVQANAPCPSVSDTGESRFLLTARLGELPYFSAEIARQLTAYRESVAKALNAIPAAVFVHTTKGPLHGQLFGGSARHGRQRAA